ncbi:MAG: MarR family transcriptional regulator [Alphaproteobacteria bacterium]|nr:MarR family transcriptional regulator [Alphaproteobacteria bacterium]NDC56694.1 MarR family transcriptional regulator [Alphaproteobacteria bacterium]NDG04985.1 MarR family transcriptional regulator [Alphaproteobacteria bacterium]
MANPATAPLNPAQVRALLLELPAQLERMHRRFLDVVRLELSTNGIQDISPVQAMMLVNVGDAELSVRDLIERGYYLGSNASYNLKQLVTGGYVERQQALRDKRAARLKLTPTGFKVLRIIHEVTAKYGDMKETSPHDIEATSRTLRKLERRWGEAVRHTLDDVDL